MGCESTKMGDDNVEAKNYIAVYGGSDGACDDIADRLRR